MGRRGVWGGLGGKTLEAQSQPWAARTRCAAFATFFFRRGRGKEEVGGNCELSTHRASGFHAGALNSRPNCSN